MTTSHEAQIAHDYGWSNYTTMRAVYDFYGFMRYNVELRDTFDEIIETCGLEDGGNRDDWHQLALVLQSYAHMLPQEVKTLASTAPINWQEIAQDTIDYLNHG